jgi:hypothetical protein
MKNITRAATPLANKARSTRLATALGALLALTSIGACGGDDSKGGDTTVDTTRTGGKSGTGGRTGSGGASGGTTGAGTGGATAGSGGSAGGAASGGDGGGGTGAGGSSGEDAASGDAPAGDAPAAADASAGSSDAAPPSGGGALPAGAIGWYEAEAVPPNTLFGGTKVAMCGTAPPCTSVDAIKEGVECCSGGKKLSQLLRGKGGVVVNDVAVPADGMYDVTWWYHCGKNDNFGDPNCGGLPHTPSGCRPHVMEINGTKLGKVSEWPCFPGSWGEIHAVTTPLAFKAGKNSIRIYATPGRDAADLDALAIYPAGMGLKPVAGTH